MSTPAPSPRAAARKILVLHAPADEAFARGYLAPALGLQEHDDRAGLTLSSAELAARPLPQLSRLIGESAVVLPVISPAFLADPWLRLSDALASHDSVDGSVCVVPLILRECDVPLYQRTVVSLDFRDPEAWADELGRLQRHLEQPAVVPPLPPCPYPGMRPFGGGEAASFHGRDDEIAELIGRLDAGVRELFVIGASGSGKSSLIAAGVVPRLLERAAAGPRPGRLLVRSMRPGAAPVRALAWALSARSDGAPPTTTAIVRSPDDALAALRLRSPDAELLLVIDQTEELFTLCSDRELRAFCRALRLLRAQPRCTLLLSVRADFFGELLQSELWSQSGQQHLNLLPMRGDQLRQAIEQPARQQRVYFEPALVDRLLGDAADEPGALPLLQETLVQLWGRQRLRLLALPEYVALGTDGRSGLATALANRADAIVRELPEAHARVARRVLLRLVAFGEGRPNTRRRQPRASLRGDEPAARFEEVLQALASSRLITVDRGERADDPDDVGVELCHDMLITAWPSFASWVEARRADEQRRRQLQSQAAVWVDRGRGTSGVLDQEELAVALAWRHSEAGKELGEDGDVTALVAASQRVLEASQRRRRLLWQTAGLATAVFVVTLVALSAFALVQRDRARANEQRAQLQSQRSDELLSRQLQELGRRLLVEGNPQRALPYLVAARLHGSGDDPTKNASLRLLWHAATRTYPRLLVRHGAPLTAVGFSRDGTTIATAGTDHVVRLWSSATGQLTAPPLLHPAEVSALSLSPDGSKLLSRCADGRVRLWNAPAAAPAIELDGSGSVTELRFSPDGARAVTGASNGDVQLWDAGTGAPFGPRLRHANGVDGLELSSDASHLAVLTSWMSTRRELTLWSVSAAAAQKKRVLTASSAKFSPDGGRLAVLHPEHFFEPQVAAIYEVASGELLEQLPRGARLQQMDFLKSGDRLALFSYDSIRVRAGSSEQLITPPFLLDHVAISQDGGAIVGESADRVIRIWSSESGKLITTVEAGTSILSLALTADGRRLITAELPDVVRVWELERDPPYRALAAAPKLNGGAISADGATVALTAQDRVQLFDARTGEPDGPLQLPAGVASGEPTFSPTGAHLAVMFVRSRQLSLCALDTRRCALLSPGWARVAGGEVEAVGPLSFSLDGERLFAATGPRQVRQWDLSSGELVGGPITIPASASGDSRVELTSLHLRSQGDLLLTTSDDGNAMLWDVRTGRAVGAPLRHPSGAPLVSGRFSPDGARFATTDAQGGAQLWDTATRAPLAALSHDLNTYVYASAWSPDGQQIVTYGQDYTARIWDAETGARLHLLLHRDRVTRAIWSPDGQRLFTLSLEDRLWDVRTGEPLSPPFARLAGTPRSPAYPPDAEAARLLAMQRTAEEAIQVAAFSPDGQQLLTVSGIGGEHEAARLWDVGLDVRPADQWQALAARSPFGLLPTTTDAPR